MSNPTQPFTSISPVEEISAYETLWTKFPSIAKIRDIFASIPRRYPLEVAAALKIPNPEIDSIKSKLRELLPFSEYTAIFRNDIEYPVGLTELNGPPEVIYFQGAFELLATRCVSVVGARKASQEGIRRARKLAKLLVENEFTVMSGLAAGIDTAAHEAALQYGGATVGVIGTPLNTVYPRDNQSLQRQISERHLLISQVPFYQTSLQDFRRNRYFFPERNKTMAALSVATVIVEASDTSGSLIQAREAIKLKRKLFILNSCFERGLSWPHRLLEQGAIRVVDGTEVLEQLHAQTSPNVQ